MSGEFNAVKAISGDNGGYTSMFDTGGTGNTGGTGGGWMSGLGDIVGGVASGLTSGQSSTAPAGGGAAPAAPEAPSGAHSSVKSGPVNFTISSAPDFTGGEGSFSGSPWVDFFVFLSLGAAAGVARSKFKKGSK